MTSQIKRAHNFFRYAILFHSKRNLLKFHFITVSTKESLNGFTIAEDEIRSGKGRSNQNRP